MNIKFKLLTFPDMDSQSDLFQTTIYETREELIAARETMADLLLFLQDEMKIMPDCSNMFIAEEYINGEWV